LQQSKSSDLIWSEIEFKGMKAVIEYSFWLSLSTLETTKLLELNGACKLDFVDRVAG